MLSIQDVVTVSVAKSRESCSLRTVRPLAPFLHFWSYRNSPWPVPVEVVSNILRIASYSAHDPISQSISTSHVCRQWRQISLSMPSLWTSVSLSLPLSESRFARTIACILRSRNCPLDIYMDFRDPSWDWEESSHVFGSTAMESIMRLLAPQASRWRSIELITDTWVPIHTFLSSTKAIDSAPVLQTIRLARCNEYLVAPGEVFRPVNLASPVVWFRGGVSLSRLRHVSLSGVHVDWARSGLCGLRELEWRYQAQDVMPTLSEFRRIFSANATLERLVIVGWGPRVDFSMENERGNGDLQMVSLPHLEELEIGFVDASNGIHLLSLFSLPNLRVLTVEDVAHGMQLCERQDSSELFDRLAEWCATGRLSFSCLRKLSLRFIHIDGTSLCGLIGQLHAVTLLTLDRVDTTTLSTVCSGLHACDHLEGLVLKDIDLAAVDFVLASCSFPPHLRVFLDVEVGDEAEEQEELSTT